MFTINSDKSIYITRGDIAAFKISAKLSEGESYTFKFGDVVRLRVFEKKRHDAVVLKKDVMAEGDSTTVTMSLTSTDTSIGDIINKPVDYWYEIELNPDTTPQTIIGYDNAGPKIFRLFPEGDDAHE